MPITWTSRVVRWAAIALIVALALLVQECRVRAARRARDEVSAVLQAEQLTSAGLKQALAVKPKEVIRNVPTIVTKEVEKVIHDKVLVPVASGSTTTTPVTVEVPTPCPATPTITTVTPVDVHLSSQFLVGVAAIDLKPWAKWSSTVTLSTPTPKWTYDVTFDEGNSTTNVTVSKDVIEAVRFKRDYHHLGWAAVIGPCYTSRQEWAACATVGYGWRK